MDKVRFVGDPVAAVAAVDEETAEEALSLIETEYEELPVVFNEEEALRPESPLIHDPRPPLQPYLASLIGDLPGGSNVCSHFKLRRGDVERGFREAEYVLLRTPFTPQRFSTCPWSPTYAWHSIPGVSSRSGPQPRCPTPFASRWQNFSIYL